MTLVDDLTRVEAAAEAADPMAEEEPEEYAIVEIFGHRRHYGRVLEVKRFGATLLRVDVPGEGGFAEGFTSHFYGGGSIFSFTPTDRATVERANRPYHAARPLIAAAEDDETVGGGAHEWVNPDNEEEWP